MDVDASRVAPWDSTCQTVLKSSINELKGVTTNERGERINDSLRFALSALQSSLAWHVIARRAKNFRAAFQRFFAYERYGDMGDLTSLPSVPPRTTDIRATSVTRG